MVVVVMAVMAGLMCSSCPKRLIPQRQSGMQKNRPDPSGVVECPPLSIKRCSLTGQVLMSQDKAGDASQQ